VRDAGRGRLRSGALLSLAGLTVLSFATLTVLAGRRASLSGEVANNMGWLVSIGAELNSVLAHRLYPRSLLALFTDSATDLTPADHRAYAMYAQAQRHKAAETIEVTFDPHEPVDPIAQTPQAPEHRRGERPPGKSS
jgi:hypothetical protein